MMEPTSIGDSIWGVLFSEKGGGDAEVQRKVRP
ncbi:hypothetical protein ANO14919_015430 [Xylariales sp. No.14919]|nr:hypothetical protein ANO14919_015430 [Xylariales sp. No.14919]